MSEDGFARPFRRRVRHSACGTVSVLSRDIAECLAVQPDAIGELRCTACREHLTASSFVWVGDTGRDEETVGWMPPPEPEPERPQPRGLARMAHSLRRRAG